MSKGDGRTIYFHNVPFSMGEDEVKEIFERAGAVANLRFFHGQNGRPKGQGLCEFETLASAVRAIRVLYGTFMSSEDGERELFLKMHEGPFNDPGSHVDARRRLGARGNSPRSARSTPFPVGNDSNVRAGREPKERRPSSPTSGRRQKHSAKSLSPRILKPVTKAKARARHQTNRDDQCSEVAQSNEGAVEGVAPLAYQDGLVVGERSKSSRSLSQSATSQSRRRSRSRSRSRIGVDAPAQTDVPVGGWAPSADHEGGEADDFAAEWEDSLAGVVHFGEDSLAAGGHQGQDDSEAPDSQDDPLGLWHRSGSGDQVTENGGEQLLREAEASGESHGDYDAPSEPE